MADVITFRSKDGLRPKDRAYHRDRRHRLLKMRPSVLEAVDRMAVVHAPVIKEGVEFPTKLLTLGIFQFHVGRSEPTSEPPSLGWLDIWTSGFYDGQVAELRWIDRRPEGGEEFAEPEFVTFLNGTWLDDAEAAIASFRELST